MNGGTFNKLLKQDLQNLSLRLPQTRINTCHLKVANGKIHYLRFGSQSIRYMPAPDNYKASIETNGFPDILSELEMEVLAVIAQGLTNSVIQLYSLNMRLQKA